MKGRDSGSCDCSGVQDLSLILSFEKEDRRNFGMNRGDLLGDPGDKLPSKTPKLRLSRLLVFFSNGSVVSSTEELEEVKSTFLRNVLSLSQDSAGVVGTEKFCRLNLGILCCEVLGKLPDEMFLLKLHGILNEVGLSRMGPTLDSRLPSLKGES